MTDTPPTSPAPTALDTLPAQLRYWRVAYTTAGAIGGFLLGMTLTASWDGVPLPPERLMPAEDVATMAWTAWSLSARSVVEDIVMRPQRGDIGEADFGDVPA